MIHFKILLPGPLLAKLPMKNNNKLRGSAQSRTSCQIKVRILDYSHKNADFREHFYDSKHGYIGKIMIIFIHNVAMPYTFC